MSVVAEGLGIEGELDVSDEGTRVLPCPKEEPWPILSVPVKVTCPSSESKSPLSWASVDEAVVQQTSANRSSALSSSLHKSSLHTLVASF